MRKKHLMHVRKAMAAFLAVAMIGQNSLVTTAESYVVEDQAIVAQEENQYEQEPQDEVQQEQPAVQEQPAAQEQVQAEPPVVQEEPAAPAEEGKTEPQGEEPPSGNVQENPTVPQENPENPEGNVQEPDETEKQGENAGSENNGQAASENPTQENGETTPVETTYHVTFDSHAADHGKIQIQGEASPIESVSAYNKELKEKERFAFSVIAEDGYEVEKIRLADTGAELSKNAEGQYELSAVTKDVKIEVLYKEISQPAAQEPEIKESQPEGEAPQETQNPEEQEKSVLEDPLILEQDTTAERTNDIINSNEEIQALENNEDVYTLIVEYEYEDGGRAENSYYGQYEAGTEFEVTVPVKNGYTITCSQEGYYDSSAGKIKGTLNSDLTLILTYSPDEVSYRVNHRFEQLDGSFTEEPETVDSVVGETTAAQVKIREGYTAVAPIQQLLVDNSTVITIEYFLNTYKVIYNTEGGTYVAPAYVKHGGTITANATPARIGYKFGGWYLDEAYNTAAGTEITVTNDFTLYAKWDAENVNYTVVYWYENADDNNYSYAYSELRQAVTGSEQTLKTATPADGVHFEFKDADKVTIKADGSTVMNVHFSRKSYTLTFKDGRKTVATIKAKYNQYIAGKFNEAPFNTTYNGRAWLDTGSTYTYALQTLDRMPDKNVTFNLYQKSSNVLKTIYYYVESVGKGEELLKTVSTYFNYMTYEEEYHEIAGFERLSRSEAGFNRESKKNFNRNNTGALYYKRKSFNLVFMNGGVRDKTESLKYEASISEKNYIPDRPEGTPDYYEFAGWYYDEAGMNEVAWATEKMPLDGLVVYAKWTPRSFTVTFDTQGGSSVDSQRVVGGTMASAPSAPTMDAYNFVGWYVSTDTNAAVFDFGMPITSDCVVYARWEKITVAGYTINYFKKGTTDPVFASESQMGYVGAKINALAKFDNNWIVDEVSKSITLGWDADKNVITFYYAEPHDVYYKVKYVDAVTGNEVAAEKIQSTRMAQVMENAVEVSGYEYDARRKSLVLNDEASEQEISHNIITFTYKPILEVTIEGNTNTVKYDGNEQKAEGFTVKNLPENSGIGFELKPGHNAEAKGIDADTYYMGLTTESFVPSFGTTSSYNGNNCVVRIKKVTDGKLTIEPREVTLTSGSGKKVYDGQPLTNSTVTVGGDGFVGSEGATYNVTGSRTDVGKNDNEFTYTLNKGTSADNYIITKTLGTLEVTPVTDQVTVTITGNKASVKYTGEEQKVNGYNVATNNPLYTVNDFKFSGTAVARGTNANDYEMGLTKANFENASKNFTNVVFEVTDGKLTIEPRKVSFTSASDSKVYDGKPLTNNNVTVGGEDGFVKGEGATFNVTGSQTNVGSSSNTFTFELNEGTLEQNYDIETHEGTLAVTADENEVVVTITEHSDTVKYDGTEHTVKGYDVNISNPLYTENDFTFSGNDEIKGKNADKYEMNLTADDFENINSNFEKVTFKIVDGSLVIEKREVELISANVSKVYDGTPLTNDTVTVSKDGFAEGEGASYNVTGSQTDVGQSDNKFTYTLNEGTLADNYDITATPGSLEVTPVTDEVIVTITENSKTFTYDGKEKSATGYTVSINNPLYTENDFTFNGFAEVSGIDAGKYDMELTPDNFENINGNFEKVTFKIEDGVLEILPAELTFRAGSDSKKYDGEPLTCAKYELVKGAIVEGQTEQVTVEGSQTLVGTSANVITAVMILAQIDKEFVDVTDNYKIIKENGELEVTDGTDDDPVDPGKVVTKTHEEKAYELGEKVTFTIRVKNIYDTTKTIRIEELAGVTIKGAAPETPNILEVPDVGAGEFVEVEATYVVTEADIAKGYFENTVKVEFIGDKPFENKDTVVTVDPVKSYTLEKKASESNHESGKFKVGETIHYTITVKNTGNQTLEKIEIQDTLQAAGIITNIQGAEYIQDGKTTTFTIRNLASQTEETQITYDYVVLEADKGNTISNAVVGSPAEPDGKTPEDGTSTEVEDPKVEVKKEVVSITAADGTQKDVARKADKDDVITYNVTVTNTGNVKLTAAKITDSLEGIQLPEGQSFELGDLECGESKSVTYTYVVKEADLGKNILNVATATAEVPEDPEETPKPEGKDQKEVPTEDPANCSIVVTKQLVNIQGDLLSVASAQFYVSLFTDEAMTQKVGETKAIIFGENQGTMSVTFDQLKRGTYYVAETDAEGNVLTSGTYNNGSFVPQYGNGNKVEITENGATAEFKFDNQFLILPDEYYMVKTITITKNVLKKNGEKLKSDETFYAGIFTDAEHTQLADMVSENIVPLAMNGKATATKTIDVTVPIGGEEVTLYITEVTADGTPVEKDDAFEYDVEVAGDTAVLSENSENAEVVITNTSRKDEPAEPVEPTKAPEETTITPAPENAVPVNGVKTGDDTPIGEFTVVLLLSAAYLVIAAIRRRKTSGR